MGPPHGSLLRYPWCSKWFVNHRKDIFGLVLDPQVPVVVFALIPSANHSHALKMESRNGVSLKLMVSLGFLTIWNLMTWGRLWGTTQPPDDLVEVHGWTVAVSTRLGTGHFHQKHGGFYRLLNIFSNVSLEIIDASYIIDFRLLRPDSGWFHSYSHVLPRFPQICMTFGITSQTRTILGVMWLTQCREHHWYDDESLFDWVLGPKWVSGLRSKPQLFGILRWDSGDIDDYESKKMRFQMK